MPGYTPKWLILKRRRAVRRLLTRRRMKTFGSILVAYARLAPAGLVLIASAAFADPCPTETTAPAVETLAGALGAATAGCDQPVTLGEALREGLPDAERATLIREIALAVTAQTGQPMSEEGIAALVDSPDGLGRLMTVGVPEIVANLRRAQAASDLRPPAPAAPEWKLPNGVDLLAAPSYFDGAITPPQRIGGSLYRGDEAASIPAERVKANRALGEVLDRLADNAGKPVAERFGVRYRGRRYTTIAGLLGRLERTGHTVTARVSQGIANFIDLRLERPNGARCDVLTPVMIETGHRGPDGAEALVPAVHSGLKISIAGPDVDAGVSFFQGIGGTRFFADGTGRDQSWVGGREVERYDGASAIRAASFAGLWRASVNEVAESQHLFGGGYGQTGLCNDSVALIQMLVTGRTTIYPLAMDHDLMGRYLDAKARAVGALGAQYRALRRAVDRLPRDVQPDPTQPSRILESIPFPDGPTPFPQVDHARKVLRAGDAGG